MYGVTIDAVLTANPNIKPTVLIVGDEILIPKDGKSQALATDPALLENISLLGANCAPMEDGLWCAMMVNNHGSYDLENGVVKLSIRDGNGEIIEERSVPTVMRLIRQGVYSGCYLFRRNPEKPMVCNRGDVVSLTIGYWHFAIFTSDGHRRKLCN